MASPNAGQLSETLINPYLLKEQFFNPTGTIAKVKFGTNGHRGSLGTGFCALHAKAISQAVADIHNENKICGKILVGGDTRLMSQAVSEICTGVLTANGLTVIMAQHPLPTPVFSFEILQKRACASLNGTASHNPPADMGLKYNPETGGPANSELTKVIEQKANYYIEHPEEIKFIYLNEAREKSLLEEHDLVTPYVEALGKMINFEAIKKAGLKMAIHPLGGTSLPYYRAIKDKYGLENLTVINDTVDPAFGFIPLDHDGKIRMDPSSQYPMGPLIKLINESDFDFAGASDPDADRFGCVTKKAGLFSPNHALSIAFKYLLDTKTEWPRNLIPARTLATTHLIDRIAKDNALETLETNVGFKYFSDGILNNQILVAGEESAGLSCHGWTTEKDGIMAVMLCAEMMAVTGKDLSELYTELTDKYGTPHYYRASAPLDQTTKEKLAKLSAKELGSLDNLAGEKVIKVRDTDGLKIYTENSWALVRPSGTEPIAKLYAETFSGKDHINKILDHAAQIFGLKF